MKITDVINKLVEIQEFANENWEKHAFIAVFTETCRDPKTKEVNEMSMITGLAGDEKYLTIALADMIRKNPFLEEIFLKAIKASKQI